MKRAWVSTFTLSLLGAWFLGMTSSGDAAELAVIQQRRRLIVAVKENVRPLGFRDQTGQLKGLEIEIAQRLAQELLGNSEAVTLQPVINRDRLAVVMNGQVDLTIAGVTATAPRTRIVSFSTPYYMDGAALLTAQPDIRRLADIRDRTIAMLQDSSTIDVIKYFLPRARLISVASYQEGQELLRTGKAQLFAGDASILSGWAQASPQYRLLPTLLSAEPLCIVMPKGQQYDSLRRAVNAAIERWRAEGWLQQRAAYWGLPLTALDLKSSENAFEAKAGFLP